MRRVRSTAEELACGRATGSLLIVDGNAATRHALAELLAESLYVVVQTASDVQTMTRACRELREPLDLALLEFRLHDGRGDLAAASLRARWPGVAIVFLACVPPDQDDALAKALFEPHSSLLLKPTSLEEVLRAVGRALSHSS